MLSVAAFKHKLTLVQHSIGCYAQISLALERKARYSPVRKPPVEGFAEAAIPKEYLSALDEYRQATHPKGRLRGEGKLFATLRLVTHSPAMWIRTGGTPDPSILVYSMTKHRETISLEIVSLFLPGDTKGGRAFRHTATHDEFSCRVDSTFPGAMLQVSLALEVLTSVFDMGTGGTPPA